MDNRVISVQSEGREAFNMAVRLLFDNAPGGKATHFYKHKTKGLVFRWSDSSPQEGTTPLVCPMGWSDTADLAWAWVQSVPEKEYGEQLDHDGDNGHGFHVYCETWGHVGDDQYAFLAVRPVMAWYGK